MTQAQEQAAEPVQTPAPHSQWKYTGEPLGTVMPDGIPLATIIEPGQVIDAEDEVQASRLQASGLFAQVSGPQVAASVSLPQIDHDLLNAPQEGHE